MRGLIINFITAFKAEHIKKKGTGIYWFSAFLGALVPIIVLIVSFFIGQQELVEGLPFNVFQDTIHDSLGGFTSFLFPLIIIITVSRVTQLDHKNEGWKLMEINPLEKFSIFFSKLLVVFTANLIAILSFIVVTILSVLLLRFVIEVPQCASTFFSWKYIIHLISRLLIASIFITVFQYIISVLIPSFIWSIMIGFLGLVATLFLSIIGKSTVLNPYKILSNVSGRINVGDVGNWFLYTEYLGIIASIIILYIGFQWYKYKTVRLAFLGTKFSLIKLFLVTGLGATLLFALYRPNQMQAHSATVVAGEITSDLPFKYLYLKDKIVRDTLAVIPIKDGKFHHVFDQNVVLDYYQFVFDDKIPGKLFFGQKDSVYMKAQFFNKVYEVEIYGSRLAENQINYKTGYSAVSFGSVKNRLEENRGLDKVEEIAEAIVEDWEDGQEKLETFKTIDNYIVRSDFTKRNNQLVVINYLNLWDELVKKRKALFPDENTEETAGIKKLKKEVSLNNESLLSDEKYHEYVSHQLVKDDESDLNQHVKVLNAIAKMKSGSFKDKILYKNLYEGLELAINPVERDSLLANYYGEIENMHYREKIVAYNQSLQKIDKGRPAKNFSAHNMEGIKSMLSDLRGKYLIIDVWASWCSPCIQETPFFEKLAFKYKDENVTFVALSIDQNMTNWLVEAKSKSKHVQQLHVDDTKMFSQNYNVYGIPTFVLIDPEGNFVNSDFPRPSESAFELLLRKELGLPDEALE